MGVGAATPLGRQVAALVAEPAVVRAHWGVYVTELDGTPIFGLNEGQLFQPASNAKLFTTAAAMALLGPDRTFETKVALRGLKEVSADGVGGALVIYGGGDANLSGRTLPYVSPNARPKGGAAAAPPDPLRYLAEMADKAVAGGLKSLQGDVIGNDTLFPWEPYPSDWSIDDAVWGYGAPVSALTVADNQLRLTMTPASIAGKPGEVLLEQAVPYYTVDGSVDTVAAKSQATGMQVIRLPGSRVLRVFGSMAVGDPGDVEEVAIEDPAEYAAMAFKSMLEQRGVTVQGVARAEHKPTGAGTYLPSGTELSFESVLQGGVQFACPEGTHVIEGTLTTHVGPPVREDVVLTNKVSENLHAELLLHHLGKLIFCQLGSTRAGLVVERAFLLHAGIDPADFVFYDGSGLSGHDLVTPRATAKLLSYAARDPKTGLPQPWFVDWKASLPVGGVDGSLGGRFAKAPLAGHVFAKTGTLGEARALSGYLECASGKTVIFSIMDTSHMPGSADRDVMDRIVAAIQAAE
jgi:D-alanyl-D-alanine carboxypeptidase/D-alanyl-D-alanine-endopeptidase (penicillin-binding protein 4)